MASRLVPLILVTACFARTPPAPPAPREASEVEASIGHTWDAVIDIFAERNIPIRTIERVSGLIVTDPVALSPGLGQEWADCGTVNDSPSFPDYAAYHVLVRGDTVRSTIKVTARWTSGVREGTSEGECTTTHVWEQNLEAEITRRAESGEPIRRGADTPSAPTPDAVPSTAPAPASAPEKGATARDSTRPAPVPRSNAELRLNAEFEYAAADCARLGLIAAYSETEFSILVVHLTDAAMKSNSTEFCLNKLFVGYRRTTGNNPGSVLDLRVAGVRVGHYELGGLIWK